MKLEDHCFNAVPPGQRDAVSCVTLSMALAAIEQAQAWKKAVDDLLATWYTTADSYATPREAIKALIAFEVMTALDPKVSSDAAALVEQARKEVSDMWLNAVTSVVSVKQAQEISHAILAQRNP